MPHRLPDRAKPEDIRLPNEDTVLMEFPAPVSVWSQAGGGKRLVAFSVGLHHVPAHLANDPYLAANGVRRVLPAPAPAVEEPALATPAEPHCTTAEPEDDGESRDDIEQLNAEEPSIEDPAPKKRRASKKKVV